MKTCALISILMLFSSCIVKNAKVESGGFSRLAPMMWNGGFPKKIQVSEDFTIDQIAVIEAMARSWNIGTEPFYSVGEKLPKLPENTNFTSLDTDGKFGIYYVEDKDMPNYGHLGASMTIAVTVLKIKTQNFGQPNEYNQIFFTDIYVKKDQYTVFRNASPGPANTYDLNSVMVHEFGHALGLEHAEGMSDTKTVMLKSLTTTYGAKTPLEYDIEKISDKYNLPRPKSPLGGAAMAIKRPNYVPDNEENKPFVKLVIELRSDGECTHSADGEIFHSHKVNLN